MNLVAAILIAIVVGLAWACISENERYHGR